MSPQDHARSPLRSSSQVVNPASDVKRQAEHKLGQTTSTVEDGPEDSVSFQESKDQLLQRVGHGSFEITDISRNSPGVGYCSTSKTHDRSKTGAVNEGLEEKMVDLSLVPETSVPTSNPVAAPVIERQQFRRPPPPSLNESTYLDPTPQTPSASKTASRASSVKGSPNSVNGGTHDPSSQQPLSSSQHPVVEEEDADEENYTQHEEENETDSKSEIQSIMDQFDNQGGGPGADEVMSPRLELAGSSMGGSIQHPPRTSSLEPINTSAFSQTAKSFQSQIFPPPTIDPPSQLEQQSNPSIAPKPSSIHSFSPQPQDNRRSSETEAPVSPILNSTLHKPPPPEPDPDSDLPFDFHRFLEQLRHRTADPVAKFLRSFLTEFGKKQWMVHEQVKIISDFLAFIANKMAQCDVWRGVSDAEFDNAREGMEKLVMNRLYSQTFSPAIPASQVASGAKGKRKAPEKLLGVGRRGQHQEDVERDEVLAQKVRIYGWVREKHLDIEPVGDSGRKFLVLAQQELLKIKTYRAPRDKVICVLNCCKVIFGLLRNSKSDTSADSFVPLLIYVVLQANPDHMVSNVQYILRFRNQDKLGGEAGYYLSSLMGAVQFIENLDRTTLTISDDEFEKNVEAAVSAIAEKHEETPLPSQVHISEKSALSRPEVTPRHSMEGERTPIRRSVSSREGLEHTTGGDGIDEKAAVAGLLRTIQRPLSTLGRIFSEDNTNQQLRAGSSGPPLVGPQPGSISGLTPAPHQQRQRQSLESNSQNRELYNVPDSVRPGNRERSDAAEAAARQASAEAAEAQRVQRAEHHTVVETLSGMFPSLDKDVISDVVRIKEGRVGAAVDACLALNS
ncbi:MAG: hypothetical protein M1835_007543 [Candelina submexicana]|nr:MAG: hypothetical protein M1835_007543 [Candelina submexicana]